MKTLMKKSTKNTGLGLGLGVLLFMVGKIIMETGSLIVLGIALAMFGYIAFVKG